MALTSEFSGGGGESPCLPCRAFAVNPGLQRGEERSVARDRPDIQQCQAAFRVRAPESLALARGTGGAGGPQTAVPELLRDSPNRYRQLRARTLFGEEQEVDVRERKKLFPAIAAQRHNQEPGTQPGVLRDLTM